MAETVFYMRGIFPLVSGRGVSAEMIADAKVLLEIQPEQLASLAQELMAFNGFLDKSTLLTTVTSFVPNEPLAKRLSRLIVQIDDTLRQNSSNLEELFKRMGEAVQDSEEEPPLLSEGEFDEIKRRMAVIIKPYPGLHRQAKAQRLSEATGLQLDRLEVICDLRPVFDDERKTVEGIIPYTILKIVCIGTDGLPTSMEAILTRAEVGELAAKSAAAVSKLEHLQVLLTEKGLPVPPVKMVRKGN